ncbi:hypothetical protein HELRODRAFT_166746 [Helobdella robusta]|uniref:Endonuclease/exonuclease/phosphatase domain-containing protein n=1 Tax=Helobdella robusta TaxID=6412 RepID=T1EYG7_HELRO|nr:hypothetical protein HELRODRAFT_166746 [Helobdella robusta]ESO11726.1 hypothetical protein HELRODRAFT_166746 [Helobdella robusta]
MWTSQTINNINTSSLFFNRYSTLYNNFNINTPAKITPCHHPPTIYILNVISIVKPHAIEHLRCGVYHLHHDIIIISKSWLRPDHPDGLIAIDGYTSSRKDRTGRQCGGGVVIYLKSSISSQIHIVLPRAINDALETLCLKCIIDFICAIYHAPNHPSYEVSTLMGSDSKLVIGGDFNQLDHHSILQTAITKYINTLIINFNSKTFTNSKLGSKAMRDQQLQSLIKKLICFNYLPASYPTVTQIFNTFDSRLFKKQIDANTLNTHFVSMSTDPSYKTSPTKATTINSRHQRQQFTPYSVLHMLTKACPSDTGPDAITISHQKTNQLPLSTCIISYFYSDIQHTRFKTIQES